MSKQNKFFAAATTAALVASAIVPVASAAEFKDANQIAPWAVEAVQTLAAKDIIGGNPDGSFNPKGNVTRAEAAKMFKVALDLPVQGTKSFTDVKDGQWFQDVIIAVSNAGIVDGMGNGLFVPNGKLTRAEAAKMIVKAYGFEGEADLSKFADADKVAGKWFEAPLSTAVAAGIIAGKGNLLAPNDSITRQEFAVMLTRAIDTAQEANTEELLAAVEKATTALDTAVKALNTEVKAEEIAAAKAEVVAAKDAITALEKAVADAKDVITTEASAKATTAIEAAKKAIATTEAVIAKAEEDAKVLAVESVTAINAQKIKVQFSKEVVGGSSAGQAENTALYSIVGLADGTTITPELQEDNKTVILSLSAPIANDTTVAVTVNPVTSKADATKSSKRYTTSFKFNDTVKPTYTGFENKTPGVATVKFSEELDQSTITTSNIIVTKANGTPVTVKTSSPSAGELLLTKKDNGFELSGLENNVEYKVAVKDVKDLSGNLTSPNVVNFTVKSTALADTEAPKVTDIVAKGLDHVVISVSEDLTKTTVGGIDTYVTLAGVTADATASQVYDKTAKTVTVKLAATLPTEGQVKTITVSGYSDVAGNSGANFTKSVGFSAISKVVKSEVVAKTVGGVAKDFVKVTFDKEITLAGGATTISASLLTKDNVVKTISLAEGKFTKGSATDKEENVLYIEVEGATGLEEGKLEIPVAKTVVTSLDKDAKVTVDYKAIASDLTAPAINTGIGSNGITVSGNKFTVNYTQDMGQSAIDVNNYTVDGVKVFESAVFKADKKTVELTLKQNALPLTAVYDVLISKAVKNEKGIALKADYVTTETITETVQPELKKAVVATNGGSVTLTFSENVTVSENAFELFVDGTKVPTTVAAVESAAGTATITVTTPLTAAQIAKTLTVKAATGAVVKDAAGNELKAFELIEVSL